MLDRIRVQGFLPADMRDAPEDAHIERILARDQEKPEVPTVGRENTVANPAPNLDARSPSEKLSAPGLPRREVGRPEVPQVVSRREGGRELGIPEVSKREPGPSPVVPQLSRRETQSPEGAPTVQRTSVSSPAQAPPLPQGHRETLVVPEVPRRDSRGPAEAPVIPQLSRREGQAEASSVPPSLSTREVPKAEDLRHERTTVKPVVPSVDRERPRPPEVPSVPDRAENTGGTIAPEIPVVEHVDFFANATFVRREGVQVHSPVWF